MADENSSVSSETGHAATITVPAACFAQTTPVVLQCPKTAEPSSPDWLATVFGMSWPFAVLLLTALLVAFGPRGRLAALLDALANFINRLKHAEFLNSKFSTEVERELDKNPAVGVHPVGNLAKAAVLNTNDDKLIEKLIKKDFSGVTIGDYPYLMHEGKRTTRDNFPYSARVYLEFWTSNEDRFQKDAVEKVFYRVDNTFPDKWWVMTSTDSDKDFQLIVRIVGEFTIIAVVKLKTGEYIWMTRYLDLPGRPTD